MGAALTMEKTAQTSTNVEQTNAIKKFPSSDMRGGQLNGAC